MIESFHDIILKDLGKDQMEAVGRLLDPSFEVDRRTTKKKIIAALELHVVETEAELSGPWDPDAAPEPDEDVKTFTEEMEELIHMTRPLTPQQQYMTPAEQKFRANLHRRLKALLEANPED